MTIDVEAVPVGLAQPKVDVSSTVGRAETPEPWVVRSEL
jgi:hypothetical protein